MSTDSKFLLENPQASYNLENCPHLRKSFIIDFYLRYLSATKLKQLDIINDKQKIIEILHQLTIVYNSSFLKWAIETLLKIANEKWAKMKNEKRKEKKKKEKRKRKKKEKGEKMGEKKIYEFPRIL